jgi:sulfur carrier protein
MGLRLTINGQVRDFAGLAATVSLAEVVVAMELKGDRIAVEHNGEIAQRARWVEINVSSGDRLEVVHFVGGGSGTRVGGLAG